MFVMLTLRRLPHIGDFGDVCYPEAVWSSVKDGVRFYVVAIHLDDLNDRRFSLVYLAVVISLRTNRLATGSAIFPLKPHYRSAPDAQHLFAWWDLPGTQGKLPAPVCIDTLLVPLFPPCRYKILPARRKYECANGILHPHLQPTRA